MTSRKVRGIAEKDDAIFSTIPQSAQLTRLFIFRVSTVLIKMGYVKILVPRIYIYEMIVGDI